MTAPTPLRRPWHRSIHSDHRVRRHALRTPSGVWRWLSWFVPWFLIGMLASLLSSGDIRLPDPFSLDFTRAAVVVVSCGALVGYFLIIYRQMLRARARANLGSALWAQAKLAQSSERERLLGEAVAAYRDALKLYGRAARPTRWAMVQSNLGGVLSEQAESVEGDARARLLEEAEAACRGALEVYSRTAAPTQWAAAQNNLGAALGRQAALVEGNERARLRQESVAAYQAALDGYTRTADPTTWASTQNNLGVPSALWRN
jgi:hypothetical protein